MNFVEVHNVHADHSNYLNPMGSSDKIGFGALWLTTKDQNILYDTECKEGIKALFFLQICFNASHYQHYFYIDIYI